jgi:hypothetical protein
MIEPKIGNVYVDLPEDTGRQLKAGMLILIIAIIISFGIIGLLVWWRITKDKDTGKKVEKTASAEYTVGVPPWTRWLLGGLVK